MAAALKTTRSAVTNGTRLHLAGVVDGRSAEARRFKDLIHAYAEGLGGESALNPAQTALVRQAAALTLEGERLQAAIISGRPVDTDDVTRLSNAALRILGELGIKRPPPAKVAPPSLDAIAARHAKAGPSP